MGPIGHAAVSSAVGAGVWAATGSPTAAGLTLGVGVLMDLDHLYDYYQVYIKGRHDKVYLLAHAWEYSLTGLAVLGLAYYHPFLLAIVLGHLGHVASDHFYNDVSPFAYFIGYRGAKGFDSAYIAPRFEVVDSYRALREALPFRRWTEPWFRRRIEPWFQERIRRISKQRVSSSQRND